MFRSLRHSGFMAGLLVAITLVTTGTEARAPVAVAAITPQAALVRVLTVTPIQSAWFAPSFLTQVSVAQVARVIAGLKAQFGPYAGVTAQPDGSFQVRFQRGTIRAQIHLDAQGRIDGLLFTNPQFSYVSRAAALTGLRALPGHVGVLVLANGAPRVAINPDAELAVGSAFKLAVLAAVRQQVAAHRLSWTQVLTLEASDKSLPSGILQDRPVGSRLPLAEVARDMIALSDNTAANMLIRVAGRGAVDPLIPLRDRPLLTTREFFVLKDPAHRALRDRYLAATTPAARLLALQDTDRLPLPALKPLARLLAVGPVAPQIEWFFSVRQLCGLMAQVSALPEMSVNPGVAAPAEWTHAAYKGGSEPGVLNLTTQVTAHDGTSYCVAATWNNSALLDEGRFEALYSSLLHSFH